MKRRKSQVKENPVENCREILKYFSKVNNVNLEFSESDKTLEEFKFSFQQNLVKHFLKFPNPASEEHENGMKLWKIATRFLNLQIANAVANGQQEIVGEGIKWEEPVTKKSRVKKSEKLDSLFFGQKYSLVQKSSEGTWFFTSPVSRFINDVNCDTNAAKIKIEPTKPLEQVQDLGKVVGAAPKQAGVRKLRRGVRFYPAEFPDYGPFHSFAPSVDLGRANLSRTDSISIRYPGRRVLFEEEPLDPEYPVKIYDGTFDSTLPVMISLPTDEELGKLNPGEEDIDMGFLGELGIDAENLIETRKDMDICDLEDEELVLRNAVLIKKLINFQDERITKGAHKVSSSELEAAVALKSNLAKLIGAFKPKELVSADQIRQAMKYIKKTEKAFRGTLSQQAPFVFPCNTAGNGVIPPGSGTVPLVLLKENRKNE